MHQLFTTPAFVLAHYEHGESSRVYKLLTRDLGLVYAHAQGVRELKNRNRFALATHGHAQVTLVRGRQTWRVTSARSDAGAGAPLVRRTLMLAGRLLPQDDPVPRVYELFQRARAQDVPLIGEAHDTYEALLALAVLHELGYVARPRSSLVDEVLLGADDMADAAQQFAPRRPELVAAVNAALFELSVRKDP